MKLSSDQLAQSLRILGPVSLGDLAVMHGWVDPKVLAEVGSEFRSTGIRPPIETLMVARQLITPGQLSTLLMEQQELGGTPGDTKCSSGTISADNVRGSMKSSPATTAMHALPGAPRKFGNLGWIAAVLVFAVAVGIFLKNDGARKDAALAAAAKARESIGKHAWAEALDQAAEGAVWEPGLRAAFDESVKGMALDRALHAKLRLATERVDAVIAEFDVHEARPDYIDKQRVQAEKEIAELIAAEPAIAGAWHQKGRLEALRWRFDDARGAFDEAMKRDANLFAAKLDHARIAAIELYLAEPAGYPPSALKEWRKSVLEREAGTMKAIRAAKAGLSSADRVVAETLEILLPDATGSAGVVIDALQKAYPRHRDPVILIWLGIVRHQSGELPAARSALELGVEDRPHSVVGHVALARVLLSAGDSDGSLRQWAEALRVDPANPHATLGRATALEKKGDHAEALKALAGNPLPGALLVKARCLRAAGKPAEAIADCSTMLTQSPRAAWARVERAKCKAALGRYKEAIDDLKAAGDADAELKARVSTLVEEYSKN